MKALIEKRANLQAQLKAVLEKAKTENRAMTAEENTEFERIEGEIRAIDTTIEAEKRAKNIPAPQVNNEPGNSLTEEQKEERAFADYIRGVALENRAGEIQLTQGNNGAIVPTTIANRIIKAVRDMVPFLQFADVITTNGNLSVPVYGEDSTNYVDADYVDERSELTDNVGKFTTIDLTGYVIGALALVSNKLKDNTDIDVVGFIVNQVAESIAEKLEKEFINGNADKISGITGATNVVTTASATAVTYDELLALKHSLKQRFRGNAKLIMNPSTYTAICKLKDGNNQPYFDDDKYEILGLPVIESDSMPEIGAGNVAVVCADLSGYTIKATKSVEVQVLREKFATKNMLGILAFCEYDGKITDSKKIAALKMKSSS